jgi:hypothetical protein
LSPFVLSNDQATLITIASGGLVKDNCSAKLW